MALQNRVLQRHLFIELVFSRAVRHMPHLSGGMSQKARGECRCTGILPVEDFYIRAVD